MAPSVGHDRFVRFNAGTSLELDRALGVLDLGEGLLALLEVGTKPALCGRREVLSQLGVGEGRVQVAFDELVHAVDRGVAAVERPAVELEEAVMQARAEAESLVDRRVEAVHEAQFERVGAVERVLELAEGEAYLSDLPVRLGLQRRALRSRIGRVDLGKGLFGLGPKDGRLSPRALLRRVDAVGEAEELL